MTTAIRIGWVLRASTVEFAVGCRVLEPHVPQFGDLVKVSLQDHTHIFGLIYDVQVQDDLAVRQLILAGEMEPEAILDQRENRLVPIEISVLIVGHQRGEAIIQGLPPQPPLSLDLLVMGSDQDIRAFSRQLDYLRLVLNASHLPADELLIANLLRTAAVQPLESRRPFLVNAGRELARLLGYDLVRLDGILRRIKPEA
ncbi:MAG: hypothetical protein AB1801_05470 [Chloroflexota bacterium]